MSVCDSYYEVTSFRKFEIKFILSELNFKNSTKEDISDMYIATLNMWIVSGLQNWTLTKGLQTQKLQRTGQLSTVQGLYQVKFLSTINQGYYFADC